MTVRGPRRTWAEFKAELEEANRRLLSAPRDATPPKQPIIGSMADAHATLLNLATEGSTTGDVEDYDYGSMCACASRIHQVDHDRLVETFEAGPGRDLAVVRARREGRPGPR